MVQVPKVELLANKLLPAVSDPVRAQKALADFQGL